MDFVKMHGLGNDFIMVDAIQEKLPEDLPAFARKVCHRRFGVGADGLILMLPSEQSDLRMRILNSDGSEPEMCGNGIRCFAVLAFEKGLVKKADMEIETLAGIIKPSIVFNDNGNITGVRVDMGEPRLAPREIPLDLDEELAVNQVIEVAGERYNYTAVSMGNPHCIIFVDKTESAPVQVVGPLIENHVLFPNKTNVEFVEVLNRSEVNMRVWERGAGETLACGTGTCATAVACVLNKKTERKVKVHLLGGDLDIEWTEDNHVFMTGPAEKVFEGKIE
jgi:diaminopimelate epimerase